jgi:hypothetical protein
MGQAFGHYYKVGFIGGDSIICRHKLRASLIFKFFVIKNDLKIHNNFSQLGFIVGVLFTFEVV